MSESSRSLHPSASRLIPTHPFTHHLPARNSPCPAPSRSPCSRWPWSRHRRRAPAPQAPAPAVVRVAATQESPDTLLSPTTQLYVRWDGITAHNDAYKKSIWGPVMAGPTGDSIRALIAKVPKLVGNSLLADPLLDGKEPGRTEGQPRGPQERLEAHRPGRRQGRDRRRGGARAGADAQGRRLGARRAARRQDARPRSADPRRPACRGRARRRRIAPRCCSRPSGSRSAQPRSRSSRSPRASARASGMVMPERGPPVPIHAAWWVEGKHFVFYFGTMRPEAVMREMAANAKKGGVTGHPLYQRVSKDPGFESVARGFVDAGRVVGLAKSLVGPFVPGRPRAHRRPRSRQTQGGRLQLRVRRQGVARDLGDRPARRAEGTRQGAVAAAARPERPAAACRRT